MSKNAFLEIFKTFKESDGDDLPSNFEVVESGDWEIMYKDYASKRTVVLDKDDGKFYAVDENRSGSYYSDYHYDDPVIQPVKPVEKIVIVYQPC